MSCEIPSQHKDPSVQVIVESLEDNKAEKSDHFFNKHFIFATPDNIHSIVKQHPSLFINPADLKEK